MAFCDDNMVELRSRIASLLDFCKELNSSNSDIKESLDRKVQHDLLKYLVYLSASDGGVVQQEADCISFLLRGNVDLALCRQAASQVIRDASFKTSAPQSFKDFCNATLPIFGREIPLALIDIYKKAGSALIISDDDLHANEVRDMNNYIELLEDTFQDALSCNADTA